MAAVVHVKARTSPYLKGPERQPVPDDKVPWEAAFDGYKPPAHTDDCVSSGPVWADKDAEFAAIRFNTVQDKINRTSFEGDYALDPATGRPLNPRGRTGLVGRGLLGRYGPNHAADPIVTRWKRYPNGQIIKDGEGRRVLEFVSVQRRDNQEWAIPGGMVEAGVTVSATLKKEFGEEAMNSLEADAAQKQHLQERLDAIFTHGTEIYKGYVDDPRNTDNAWMETVAVNFHDDDGETFGHFELEGGDDAQAARWCTITPDLGLYASHKSFIDAVWKLQQQRQASDPPSVGCCCM